jgi:flagellin-specific chaperone FliS
MSAKDRAFERERQRLLSRIRDLEAALADQSMAAAGFRAALQKRDARIQELEQQVETLSRALSREDLQLLLDSEKKKQELAENLNTLFRFAGRF